MRWSLTTAASVVTATLVLAAQPTADTPIVTAKPEAHRTLVNPDCSHCKDEAKRRAAQLRDDDRVLCWVRGKYQGGAIPWRFYLAPYRVISDTYGVFVYDPDAGFARGFEPSLDFDFYGWRNGVMVMRHKNGSLYSTLTGVAFDGPDKGKQLKVIPTLECEWGPWNKLYPDTVAYKMYDKYQPIDLPTKADEDSVRSRAKPDPRLPGETPVVGLWLNGKSKAYPISRLSKAGVINDELAGDQIAIFWFAPTRTAVAYKNTGQTPFQLDDKHPQAPFIRKSEPSAHHDVTGRLEGSKDLEGLPWVDSVQVKWFAWAAEHPETALYESK
jgi:hypothetical protein